MATNNKSHRGAKEVKEQIVKRIKDEGVSVSEAAKEHGLSTQTIYGWLTKGASGSPSWAEIARLKRENKSLLELVGEITMKLSASQKKN